MKKIWTDDGWYDYLYWQAQDKKTLKKINELIKDIERNGLLTGIGKPEKLKYRNNQYSRRIDQTNRLIYSIDSSENIIIYSCRGHYSE
ncbi:MAG: Txe/YoeB family addiction module toxin [Clostridiales bacterium]|nr:MAG: Txe/YoeB family addiction module toxin [Clostridiales bacterium]